jgi:hypothetical protein
MFLGAKSLFYRLKFQNLGIQEDFISTWIFGILLCKILVAETFVRKTLVSLLYWPGGVVGTAIS